MDWLRRGNFMVPNLPRDMCISCRQYYSIKSFCRFLHSSCSCLLCSPIKVSSFYQVCFIHWIIFFINCLIGNIVCSLMLTLRSSCLMSFLIVIILFRFILIGAGNQLFIWEAILELVIQNITLFRSIFNILGQSWIRWLDQSIHNTWNFLKGMLGCGRIPLEYGGRTGAGGNGF